MYIVMITGSPHRHGTSALLADEFIRGAKESGHTVFRFDTAFECVHPCIGCETCQMGRMPCALQDAMTELYRELKKADMVVFVSPIYYHALSAQIKMAIDRFHGIEKDLQARTRKAILLMTAGAGGESVASGALLSHSITLRHLGWEDAGHLLALNSYTKADIEKTDYPRKAYEMGKAVQ